MMAKETILRLLEVDSVKDCGGNVLEVLEEMRYRYELERKIIALVSSLPGYQGDESVEAVHTKTLEMILQSFEEHGVD
jgi:hypothetical protein